MNKTASHSDTFFFFLRINSSVEHVDGRGSAFAGRSVAVFGVNGALIHTLVPHGDGGVCHS